MSVRMHVCNNVSVCTYVLMYECLQSCMYVCVHVLCVYVCIHVYMYVRICVCTPAGMNMHVCLSL